MRGLFSYPANISALPDGYMVREILFLLCRYDRTVSVGSRIGLRSERINLPVTSALMTRLCQLGVEVPWKVRATFLLSSVVSEL